jgi:hypothetical protein
MSGPRLLIEIKIQKLTFERSTSWHRLNAVRLPHHRSAFHDVSQIGHADAVRDFRVIGRFLI